MTDVPASAADLRRARLAFRAARHALARAVLVDDDRALVDACWRLLRANDRVTRLAAHPSTRDARTRRRWRGFALAALADRVPAGLTSRARRLARIQAEKPGEPNDDHRDQ